MNRFGARRQNDPADNEFVDIEVYVHATSMKAVLISRPNGSEHSAVWTPKSQATGVSSLRIGDTAIIGVKRWFLRKENILDWEV